MEVQICPRCSKPMESSNYFLKSMTIKCRNCGYSYLPLAGGACIYEHIDVELDSDGDAMLLELKGLSSKLAVIGLFASVISIWSIDLKAFAISSFFAFLIFSGLYLYLRNRG